MTALKPHASEIPANKSQDNFGKINTILEIELQSLAQSDYHDTCTIIVIHLFSSRSILVASHVLFYSAAPKQRPFQVLATHLLQILLLHLPAIHSSDLNHFITCAQPRLAPISNIIYY